MVNIDKIPSNNCSEANRALISILALMWHGCGICVRDCGHMVVQLAQIHAAGNNNGRGDVLYDNSNASLSKRILNMNKNEHRFYSNFVFEKGILTASTD